MVFRLRGRGFSWEKIARAAGCSISGAWTCGRTPRKARPATWAPRPGRLTIGDREEIVIGLTKGETFTRIASRIGKAPPPSAEKWRQTEAAMTTGPGEATSGRGSKPVVRNQPR
jgi:hypothetical protein